jgi:hypothetical protein
MPNNNIFQKNFSKRLNLKFSFWKAWPCFRSALPSPALWRSRKNQNVNRIASQKNAPLRGSRWREVHEKFTRFFFSGLWEHASTSGATPPSGGGTSGSTQFFEEKKTTSFFPNSYVPWQTTTHAWAGIRGMLRSAGLEGHSRPETLNLTAWNHAQGLSSTQKASFATLCVCVCVCACGCGCVGVRACHCVGPSSVQVSAYFVTAQTSLLPVSQHC